MLSAKKQQLEEIIGANNFSNIESLTSDEDILPSLVMTLNQKNNKKHSLSFVESECFFMGIYFSAVLDKPILAISPSTFAMRAL